jgi:hypothetical protein
LKPEFLQKSCAARLKTTRRDVVGWILAAEENISLATRRNAWRKTGFAYFSD